MQEEFDTFDPKAHYFLKLQFLKKRSKIIEIIAARDVIFALAQSGLCAAFSRSMTFIHSHHHSVSLTIVRTASDFSLAMFVTATNERICFLNISPDEVIRSLFYNKNNDSIITVSVYASDCFSSLKCRTTPIE